MSEKPPRPNAWITRNKDFRLIMHLVPPLAHDKDGNWFSLGVQIPLTEMLRDSDLELEFGVTEGLKWNSAPLPIWFLNTPFGSWVPIKPKIMSIHKLKITEECDCIKCRFRDSGNGRCKQTQSSMFGKIGWKGTHCDLFEKVLPEGNRFSNTCGWSKYSSLMEKPKKLWNCKHVDICEADLCLPYVCGKGEFKFGA
jgi:hypothetical protein